MLISTKITDEIPQPSTKQKDLFGEVVNCDLCGEDDFKPFFDECGFTFGQCRNCSLYYIRLRPTEESQAKIVRDASFKKFRSSMKEEFLEWSLFREQECSEYLETIENFVKEGRLLDVGCGIGTFMWFAEKRRWQVEGIELNKQKLAIAIDMNIGTIHSKPVEELNLAQASYDIVTMINVFAHLRSPKNTLSHLMSVIKPKGFLLMRTGEFRHNPTKRDLPPWGLGIPQHLFWNSEKTFELYGKAIDAEIVYYKSIPYNEYFIRNMFKYKSKKWYKQISKTIFRNIPGLINFIVSLDNWNKRKNPIYDTTIIYQKHS
jgi:2-polyprenyl-3-methyl-5-hydroxy-6-metoxy-1,4-benzoquinol methylase